MANEKTDKKAAAPQLAPEYRGTKTYRLTQPHYRLGRYYEAGETITVIDEKPSASWVLVEDVAAKAAAPVAPALGQRPNDVAL